jgi:hypothetical protein
MLPLNSVHDQKVWSGIVVVSSSFALDLNEFFFQKSVNDFGANGEVVKARKVDDELTEYVLSPNCPRAFGLFAVEGSCRRYYHCRLLLLQFLSFLCRYINYTFSN